MLGVDRDDPTQGTYADIVDAARPRQQHAARHRRAGIGASLSILINNVDDHLHNHGFLHEATPSAR
ncbi:MAG: hypothetical protein U1G05_16775 [Kiritimatiellia bacterium]